MTLLTFDEALATILRAASPLQTIDINISQAQGHFLAADVYSTLDLPRFENSQMDGYAVRFSELPPVSSNYPTAICVTGMAPAGKSMPSRPADGSAVKIFTGAQMPVDFDAVIPIEDVDASEDGSSITIHKRPSPGQFVRHRAEDIAAGQVVSRQGDKVTPGRLALLASVGKNALHVYRCPRVLVLVNGDELVGISTPSNKLSPGQIYESNSIMLAALVNDCGADLAGVITVQDSLEAIAEQIVSSIETLAPDVIIASGGVSVGDRDFIRAALLRLGEVVFWRASIRPGKPILYGRIGAAHFLGLPGNPASTMVTFELFARPLLAKLAGSRESIRFLPASTAVDVEHISGRTSFVRAIVSLTSEGLKCIPAGLQGSHFVSSLAEANALFEIPAAVTRLGAGSHVRCLLTGPLNGDS